MAHCGKIIGMKVYLVGGAVRDRLLGLSGGDKDWVVVGATPADLTARGYTQVGKDFPVFLHPVTHEEYALARQERKAGHGYHGFATSYAPDVTLEADLLRRDLTVNAMAQPVDADGNPAGDVVDPYGGRADLEARLLRHVSPAFVEDPLRVLRVARFAARFAPLGFSIAAETRLLLRQIVDSGEISHLTPERVWRETARALDEARPEVYFQTLRECGALAVLFPELAALDGVPQPPQWHPEIDTFVHTMLSIRYAADAGESTDVRFAALVHDLGKALTPKDKWPSHHGHEALGVAPIEALCQRLRVPTEYRDLAALTARHHLQVHRAFELRPEKLLKLLQECDAWRKPVRFRSLLRACIADTRGRTGLENQPYPQAGYLGRALDAALAVTLTADESAGLQGRQIGEALTAKRLAALTRHKAHEAASATAAPR